MAQEKRLLYSIFKLLLVVCFILGGEYAWSYIVYSAASFGARYLTDSTVWLLAGTILFTEGLNSYLKNLLEGLR